MNPSFALSRKIQNFSLLAAICLPWMLAKNVQPSATVWNIATAWILWGATGLFTPQSKEFLAKSIRNNFLLIAFLTLLVWISISPLLQDGPLDKGLAASLTIAAAAIILISSQKSDQAYFSSTSITLAKGLVACGILGTAIGILQIYLPNYTDGQLIAHSHATGRATGNIRQPNHLALSIMWGCAGCAILIETKAAKFRSALALLTILTLGLNLAGSRTEFIISCLLPIYALIFRKKFSHQTRKALSLIPVFTLSWSIALKFINRIFAPSVLTEMSAAQGNSDGGRFSIYIDALNIIKEHPLTGVGWGEFNYIWTLTPNPTRKASYFDNAHNIVIQFASEIGIPATLISIAIVAWLFKRAIKDNITENPGTDSGTRAALLLIPSLAILANQTEFPFWYAYILFPSAFTLGLCLSGAADYAAQPTRNTSSRAKILAANLMVFASGLFIIHDYNKVIPVFNPPEEGEAAPLSERMKNASGSLFFYSTAAYAPATRFRKDTQALPFCRVAFHFLIDSHLLKNCAAAYRANGMDDVAEYLDDRRIEFDKSPNKYLSSQQKRSPITGFSEFKEIDQQIR